MSNEKYYDYYKTDADTRIQLEKEFSESVASQRDEILEKMKDNTGCIAWRERSGFGKSDYICELVFPADHKIVSEPFIKIESRMKHEGQNVVCVSGMGNRKLGKEFNAAIGDYNKQLEKCPKYTDWIITKLNVMRTGFGGVGSKGYGTSMLSSYGGNSGNVVVVAIPNSDDTERHGSVTIPNCLEKISYGNFYDLTNS